MVKEPTRVTVLSDREAESLLAEIKASVSSYYKEAKLLHTGARFLLASSLHLGTDRKVLWTIAPPGAESSISQLTTMRKAFDLIADARIGSTHDRIWGRSADGSPSWGCLVSTFHDGAVPVDKSLVASSGTIPSVDPWLLVKDLAEQVRAIHTAGYAHGDLSTTNIVADPLGKCHLIDFEHCVDKDMSTQSIAYTEGFSHPGKKSIGSLQSVDLKIHQTWDLYAVGQIYLDILSLITPSRFPSMTVFRQRAVRTIACMLLDGRNTQSETAMGLPTNFFAENRVDSAVQLCAILDRLSGRPDSSDHVPELRSGVDRVIEVGSSRPAPHTLRVNEVLRQPEFRYLDTFNQLGLISFIWPKATHRRYVHALGTFSTCCDAADNMLADPQNPIFSILMDAAKVRTLLCAALLHDVGHYPVAHDIEEALPGFLDHENRSVRILSSDVWIKLLGKSESTGGWNIDSRDVASVINGSPIPGSKISESVCHLLHTIISGSLDVDKLDYLVRDSLMLDVKAGEGIDRDRIFAGLTVAVVKESNDAPKLTIAIAEKSRRPAELVGRVRSHLFGVAYWHHNYRAIKCMIQWMIWCSVMKVSSPKVQPQPGALPASTSVQGGSGLLVEPTSAAIKALCAEFLAFIDLDVSYGVNDRELLKPTDYESLYMPSREARTLSWWAAKGGAPAEAILNGLDNGKPFATILELSHPDRISVASIGSSSPVASIEIAREIWKTLGSVPARFRKKSAYIKFRYLLASEFQRQVQQWLISRREGDTQTIVYGFLDIRDQFISKTNEEQLFLVDFPDEGKSYQKPLYVAASESKFRTSADSVAGIEVTRSFDSIRVGEEFVVSNGYVRIFCHTFHSKFIEQSISDATMCNLLLQAIRDASRQCGVAL